MKKPFISALILSSALPLVAAAAPVHYYDPGYYDNSSTARPQAYQRVYQPAYAPMPAYQGQAAQHAAPAQTYQGPRYRATNNPTGHCYNCQPAQTGAQGNYYAPHQVSPRKQRDIGAFSVGADYVLGYGQYKSTDFVVPSSLFGGEDYVADTKSFDKQFNSVSFNFGFRPLRHIGMEAFYTASFNQKHIAYTESYTHFPEFARGEYEVSYKAYGLDVIGYFPINDYIEFLAAIGVGKYDAQAKIKVVAYEDTTHTTLRSEGKNFEDSKWTYRIGGGFQFWLSKHLTLRIMGRWIPINGEFMKSVTEINAGVRYHF